jgi:hypothetical protein
MRPANIKSCYIYSILSFIISLCGLEYFSYAASADAATANINVNTLRSPLAKTVQAHVVEVQQIMAGQLSIQDKLQALESVRLDHASRYQQYYYTRFEELRQLESNSIRSLDSSSIHAWYRNNRVTLSPKRNGIAAVSAIIDDRKHIIMCTVPKIDSTTWRKVMLYLQHPELYKKTAAVGTGASTDAVDRKPPDQHNIKKNGVKLMAHQSPLAADAYYNNAKYLKVFHCRNPVVRVLSAWISKNANSLNPIAFAADYGTFGDFIHNLRDKSVNLSRADAHIRHQHSYCDADRGAHYDILLKLETRIYWNYYLLNFMKLQNDSFVLPLFLKYTKPKADRLDVFLKHYTPDLLNIVKELYAKDIDMFEYSEDVLLLEAIIKEDSKKKITTMSKPPV